MTPSSNELNPVPLFRTEQRHTGALDTVPPPRPHLRVQAPTDSWGSGRGTLLTCRPPCPLGADETLETRVWVPSLWFWTGGPPNRGRIKVSEQAGGV